MEEVRQDPSVLLFAQEQPAWMLAKQMVSGGVAGMVADGITYPMCTVKSRMQVQGAQLAAGKVAYAYKGPLDALWTMAAREGWRTLFKGFGTVVQVAPAQALYMGAYQASKQFLPGSEESPMTQFAGGVIATVAQSLAMVPLEVVRQRQQVQTNTSGAYQGSLDAARTIVRTEGPLALYRGFAMTQMVWGPFNAIYLPLWEGTKVLAARYTGVGTVDRLDVRWELGASFGSSAVAAAVTNPADVIKTRLQVQGSSNIANSTNYSGPIDAARSIFRHEGFKGFFRGTMSRVWWVAPSSTIMFTSYDQLMKALV